DDVAQTPTTIGGVAGIEVAIRGEDTANVILYFHGGVYVIGSAASSVPLVADLARRTGARAITLDYRLAPERPDPAADEAAQAAPQSRTCRSGSRSLLVSRTCSKDSRRCWRRAMPRSTEQQPS